MKIITDSDNHFLFLSKAITEHKPEKCFISTFNIFTGITHEGKSVVTDYGYTNMGHDFLELLKEYKVKTNIIVGLPYFMECKPDCPECKADYEKRVTRIKKHEEHWPEFEWLLVEKYHSKYIVFDTGHCFIGGRNVTTSDFRDLTFMIEDKKLYCRMRQIHGESLHYYLP